jgi:hypothetical protein
MKPCNGCPFNDGTTDEATRAQNYGCLPTAHEMVKHFDEHTRSIGCHGASGRLCRGLLGVRPEAIDKPVKDYEDWYNNG